MKPLFEYQHEFRSKRKISLAVCALLLGGSISAKDIAFIDENVKDFNVIMNALPKDTQAVIVDSHKDGLKQMADVLKTQTNLDAVHIVSHGESGKIFLGNSALTATTLGLYKNELEAFQTALKQGGDILLYGCNVAKGEEGKTFINSLAKITGADIGASTNLTGNNKLGGDWVLEEKTGLIASAMLALPEWSGMLGWTNLKTISPDAIPSGVYTSLDNYDITAYYSDVGSIKYQFDNANNMYISYVSGGWAEEWTYPTVYTTHVLKYNGSTWTELGTGQSMTDSSLAVNKTTGDVYLGTGSSILHYNSSTNAWETIGTNSDSYISGYVRDGLKFGADGTLYHAYIRGINETNKRFILRKYNGTPNSWTELTPSGGYVDGLGYGVTSDGTLYVLRTTNYNPSNSNWDTSIEKYSNGSWSNYYLNTSTSYGHGIYIPSSDDVYITEQAISTHWSVAKIESGNTRTNTGLSATNYVNHFFVGHDGNLYAVKLSNGYRIYKYDGATSWNEVGVTNQDYPTPIYSTTVDVGPDGSVYELGVPAYEDDPYDNYTIQIYKGIIEKLVTTDTTPNAFTFTDRTEANLSAVITSNTITVTGIDAPTALSLAGSGCQYDVNGSGNYTSSADNVALDSNITVRVTSSSSYNTATNCILTIGGVSDVFTVTTKANTAPTANDSNYSTSIVSSAKTFDWKTLSGASDAEGQTLNATLTTPPTKGTVSINGTQVTYTPSALKSGNDSFVLTINDGFGGTKTITIGVTGIDTLPSLRASFDKTTPTSTMLILNPSLTGTGYFTLLSANGTCGTSTQIKNGYDNSNSSALKWGSYNVTATTDSSYWLKGLTAGTGYKLCTLLTASATDSSVVETNVTTSLETNLSTFKWIKAGNSGVAPLSTTGLTALTFSVDNTPYAVTGNTDLLLQQFVNEAWNGIDTISNANAKELKLLVAPDSHLYMGYVNTDGFVLKKYNSTVVSDVATLSGASRVSLAFGFDMTPYVSFRDSTNANKLSIKKYTNSSWSSVGSAVSTHAIAKSALAFDKNGYPWVAYVDAVTYEVSVIAYNGSSWNVQGVAMGQGVKEVELIFGADHTPYVAYKESFSAKTVVKKFDGSAWVSVANANSSVGVE